MSLYIYVHARSHPQPFCLKHLQTPCTIDVQLDVTVWFMHAARQMDCTCRSRVGRCVASVVVVVVVKHIISGWKHYKLNILFPVGGPNLCQKVKPAERGNSLPSSTQVYG